MPDPASLAAPQLSFRAADMPRSAIRRIFGAAQELERQGVDVARLDIGDPDLPMPGRIADGIRDALNAGRTHYSAMGGLPELRSAMADYTTRRFLASSAPADESDSFGLNSLDGSRVVGPDLVTVHQGATQALNAVLQLTCDSSASILLPEIYFPNYIQQTTLSGVRPRFYALDEHYMPLLSDLPGLADGTTRAILVNSPSNPTGALFPPETLRALYDFAAQNNLWIISDEAYCEYVFEGEQLTMLELDYAQPPDRRRVVSIYSASKSFAATGLRLGWSAAPRADVAARLLLMNEPFTGSLTTPLQYGLLRAFEEDDCAQRCDLLRPRREHAAEALRASGLPFEAPGGGIFLFADITSLGLDSETFADRALAEAHVAVVPGGGFGLQPRYHADGRISFTPGAHAARCIRICFGVNEERMRSGVQRLCAFIDGLRG